MKISLDSLSRAQKLALVALLDKAQLLSEPHSRFLDDLALANVGKEVGEAFRDFKNAPNNVGF